MTSEKQTKVHVRWIIRRDMPEVLAIENDCFADFPWSEEDFMRCLRQRNCIGMVAEHEQRIVGYVMYELHQTRLHILNIAVERGRWLEGIGRQLIKKLIFKCSPQRRSRITCEVRESNLPALLFFQHCGFGAVTMLHEYYADSPEESAIVMQWPWSPEDEHGRFTRRVTR